MMTRSFGSFSLLARIAAGLACLQVALITPAVALEINPDIATVEKALESKIEQTVRTYLGDESKVITHVYIKESIRGPATKAKGTDAGIDIIYAPVPFISVPEANNISSRRSLLIKSVEAEVQVAGDTDGALIDDAVLASVKSIVEKTLKGFNAKVTVSKLELPPKRAPAEKGFLERQNLDAKSLLPVVSLVLAALIMALGVGFVARSLRASANTLVHGFSRIFVSTHSQDGGDGKPLVFETRGEAATREAGRADPAYSAAHFKNYERNLAVVKETLAQSPMVFLRTIRDEQEELRGIKWLLPSLATEEQQNLKNYFGRAGLPRVSEMEHLRAPADPMIWLQDFVERLMLRKIDERTQVERAIGAEKASRLYLAETKHLIQAVRKINTPASWRVLSEFTSRENLDKVISNVEPSDWMPLFKAAELNASALSSAADEILSVISKIPHEEAEAEERAGFYTRTLLEPVLQTLARKEPAQGDDFLKQIGAQAPELAALVRERYWSVNQLTRVPDDVLAAAFRDMRNEQRVSVLLALPPVHADRLLTLLPQGNVRTIVADQLAKTRSKKDPVEQKAAVASALQFIERLRQNYVSGEFQLLPDREIAPGPNLKIAA